MAQLGLSNQVFFSNNYKKVINTSFNELVSPPVNQSSVDIPTEISEFFQKYQQLFYFIPKFGETESHEYIIKTSSEYVGTSESQNEEIQALINEITSLRQTNLELNQQLINAKINNG